ncbi:MAG: hypothetical protein ACYS0D_03315 [Planctomycetota bacterium]|jgi:hypothetical protein
MRCRTCDYPLWNLTNRTCPECGHPFRIADFEFAPYTVRFCCPGCQQEYYGTSPAGHLQPATFECVRCGRAVTMEQMVLLPTAGLEERATHAERVEWLERRRRGFLRSWLRTVWMAMVNPGRLIRALPGDASLLSAWWFAIFTAMGTILVAVVPWVAFLILMPILVTMLGGPGAGGGGVGAMVAGVMTVTAVGLILVAVLFFLGTVLWGLIIHGLLKLTGATAGTLRHTYHGLCYASGANLTAAFPCAGQYVGWIWWVISTVLMVKEVHQVRAWRAVVSVIALPATVLVLIVAGYVGIFVYSLANPALAQAQTLANNLQRAQSISNDLQAAAAGGSWPAHGLELLDPDDVMAGDFVAAGTLTTVDDIPLGEGSMGDFVLESQSVRRGAIKDAAAALPSGTVAHRVGDVVFTYHGVDPASTDSGLWVFVIVPDPVINGPPHPDERVIIGMASGRSLPISYKGLAELLDDQNRYRASLGLPHLPDPADVTHAEPGVESPPPS